MENITLAKAKSIAVLINKYGEKNPDLDFGLLVKYVEKNIRTTQEEVTKVVQFLQEIQGAAETLPIYTPDDGITMQERVNKFIGVPINLSDEITYNYGVARSLLAIILEKGTSPDNEEVRKTLREISRFSDAMLKMQERVFNVQTLQAFQEAIYTVLEDESPRVKDKIVELLLEAEL